MVDLVLSDEAAAIARLLLDAGWQVFVVGGAVRDGLLGRVPRDIDLATDAPPDRVGAILGSGGLRPVLDDAAFGRVLVGTVDVLTLRREAEYKDRRRPSRVEFTDSVEQDLARRDFTANAMAIDLRDGALIDPHRGTTDIERGILRAVGPAPRRLREDALRLLRAVRLRAELGFSYHPALARALAMPSLGRGIGLLSAERVRDELSRLLLAPGVLQGLDDLRRFGLLPRVLPECVPMVGCPQDSPMHQWDVWEHALYATQTIAVTLPLRWAALLHDVAKPACRTTDETGRGHFYGHERVGEGVARDVLRRLRYGHDFVNQVAALVRHHMFHYGPETGLGAARRLVLALGASGVRDLLELRRADRQASLWGYGVGPEGERLTVHLREIATERFARNDLEIDGHDVMRETGWDRGPDIGRALRAVHQRVLDGAVPNRRDALLTALRDWLREGL